MQEFHEFLLPFQIYSMTTIKRYSNRKLYDTETKRYITLSDVITMLREGKDITVIDNQSGRDITNLTLTQTILELEKKHGGHFPRHILKNLISTGSHALEKTWSTIPSPSSLFQVIDVLIEKRINRLIRQGTITKSEGQRIIADLSKAPLAESWISDQFFENLFERFNIPTRDKLNALTSSIDALIQQIDETLEK